MIKYRSLPLIILLMYVISTAYESHAFSIESRSSRHLDLLPRTKTSRKTSNSIFVLQATAGMWMENFSSSALRNVENLAESVTRANDDAYDDMNLDDNNSAAAPSKSGWHPVEIIKYVYLLLSLFFLSLLHSCEI